MVIVVIHWKIKRKRTEEFLEYWRKEAVVQDRAGLIGEFLSDVCDETEFPWITWHLTGSDVYRSFVNVGLWTNPTDFHDQIGKYFNDKVPPKEFEYERRVRTILRSKCWRIGDSRLPVHDSGGTL